MHLAQSPALDLADPLPGMTFVTLVRLTAESANTIDEGRSATRQTRNSFMTPGGRVAAAYGLLGEYDIVTVTELPNEKAAARIALAVASS